jgi:hypothetical protein
MIRIGSSSLPPDAALASASGPPASSHTGRAAVQVPDQVQLSHLTATVLQGRSDKIARLRTIVASPNYSPSPVSVSRSLIAGALSRPN